MNRSADFPYQSHYIDVLGSKMHYLDEGKGDPILFLHGIPTSSYLWRNVMPHLLPNARCIALDLIGMGKSDKPDIDYRVFDHIDHVEQFLDALNLHNVTLVVHGWGSVIGLHWAMQHPDRVKGVVLMESHLRPEPKETLSLFMQQIHSLLQSPEKTYELVVHSDHFIDRIFPGGVLRRLSEDELASYREPFQEADHRKLLWQYLQDIPVGEEPADVVALIQQYSDLLQQSQLPKLMLYGIPGFHTTVDTIVWAKQSLPNLTVVDIGEALHYAPESDPDAVGRAIVEWYQAL